MRESAIESLGGVLSEKYERTILGTFPTKVERLSPSLVEGAPELWIKRDDLSSQIYGGNKTRKLEFLLGPSERPVLTFGPLGSHHVLSTALHAKALGRRCAALLVPQAMTPHHWDIHRGIVANCDPVFELSYHPRAIFPLLRATLAALRMGKHRYQFCPPGGTSPLGTLGYVLGGLELANQVRQGLLPEPQQVFVPLGTGGTAVGLAIAFALAGMKTETVAVRVVPRLALPRVMLSLLAARTLKLIIAAEPSLAGHTKLRLIVDDGFSEGYARPTKAGREALSVGESFGIPLESTYSAKTFAAFLASARKVQPGTGPLLFWQTFSASSP